jgi:hypothetical protein
MKEQDYICNCAGILRTVYWGYESSRNRVVVTPPQATYAVGIDSLESLLGLLNNLIIPALMSGGEGIHPYSQV